MKKTICLIFTVFMLLFMTGAASAASEIYSASVEGEISLYISPDDENYVITKVPACSKLKLLRTEKTWGLVEFENKAGWINLSFTRKNYSKAAEATGNDSTKSVQVKAESGRVSLYNVPTDDIMLGSSIKYNVPNGTVLKITRETKAGWGLVSMNGKYAWIKMDKTVPHTVKTDMEQFGIYYVYVLSQKGIGAELWDSPGAGNLCAVIPDCIKLTVREKKGEYGYVSYDAINGWIKLSDTTESLSNAQMNSGDEVNSEYTVTPKDGAQKVSVLSVPSEKKGDGAVAVSSIGAGEAVFVLRSSMGGWSLVNHNGELGWISPENLTPAEITQDGEIIDILENPSVGFVSTAEGKGIEIFSDTDEESKVATIPEGVKISVVAEKGGYKYVYCGYASGWIKSVPMAESFEEFLEKYPGEKLKFYRTDRETEFMSLPTGNELCGSEVITLLPEGEYFTAIKTVTTSKTKWVLAEINGEKGWIRLSHAEKARLSLMLVLLVLMILSVLLAIAALTVHLVRKKKFRKTEKEVGKNEEGILNENSGTGEKASDVSRQ